MPCRALKNESKRDNTAWKKVSSLLTNFKSNVARTAKELGSARQHKGLLNYSLATLRMAAYLPVWDDIKHNKGREALIGQLTKHVCLDKLRVCI